MHGSTNIKKTLEVVYSPEAVVDQNFVYNNSLFFCVISFKLQAYEKLFCRNVI